MKPKTIILTLLTIAAAGVTFADTPDCDKALESCNDECRQTKILDQIEKTDFQAQCLNSCSKGFDSCKIQDSENACGSFSIHCVDNCPWTVNGSATGLQYSNQGSFAECMDACDKGTDDCAEVSKKTPPRKRTGKFDPCLEAQGSCYESCAGTVIENEGESADYMDLCAEACYRAIPACQQAAPAQKCQTYTNECQKWCPDEIHNANGYSIANVDSRSYCNADCSMGESECKYIQGGK